jgi:transposase-like protein
VARGYLDGIAEHLTRRAIGIAILQLLEGLPEVASNLWPQAIVQTCIIHLIRNTFRLTSRKYWDEIKRDVKPIYTAVNAAAARSAFDDCPRNGDSATRR